MTAQIFEIDFTDGPAYRIHEKAVGRIDASYPWETLDPSRYPIALVERSRVSWTENAFNELCTAIVFGQLLRAMGEACVPLDLWSLASRFPREELIHVELCARVAMQLGGGVALTYDPDDIAIELDPSLTPLERATELVVRICCVGESLSLPLLSGSMKSATHPLTQKVLKKIVRDEAMHGNLGWLYLDWIGSSLRASERDRLGRIAKATIETYEPLWERLRSRAEDGMTSEGYRVEHVRELGWMEAEAYRHAAVGAVAASVIEPLSRYGIRVQ